jgi:hypothetical protein
VLSDARKILFDTFFDTDVRSLGAMTPAVKNNKYGGFSAFCGDNVHGCTLLIFAEKQSGAQR